MSDARAPKTGPRGGRRVVQLEEYAKLKITSAPENLPRILDELRRVFIVATTSGVIQHHEDRQAHVFAIIYLKEDGSSERP